MEKQRTLTPRSHNLLRSPNTPVHSSSAQHKQQMWKTVFYEFIPLKKRIITFMNLWDKRGNGIGFIPRGALNFILSGTEI